MKAPWDVAERLAILQESVVVVVDGERTIRERLCEIKRKMWHSVASFFIILWIFTHFAEQINIISDRYQSRHSNQKLYNLFWLLQLRGFSCPEPNYTNVISAQPQLSGGYPQTKYIQYRPTFAVYFKHKKMRIFLTWPSADMEFFHLKRNKTKGEKKKRRKGNEGENKTVFIKK